MLVFSETGAKVSQAFRCVCEITIDTSDSNATLSIDSWIVNNVIVD